MGTSWPLVPLGDVLAPVSRPEPVKPDKTYSILGAHWYAQGLYTKEITTGAGIQANSLYCVHQGDFVYNRLFAWKGSFAVATQENDGCYVSNEFPCFRAHSERLDAMFLWKYFSRSSAWDEALAGSTGGTPTSRNRLKEDKLLAFRIPLPALDEQRRIVARIEALSAKIEEARGLRLQSHAQVQRLYPAKIAVCMDSHGKGWKRETVGEVILSMDAGWSPQCDDIPARKGEWGVLKTTSVQWCEFRPDENKVLPPGLEPIPELAAREGDVLVTRAGPLKRVGVVAAVRKSEPQLTISDKLIRLRPDPGKVEPRFLELSLSSPFSQEHLFHRKTGLAEAQVNISQAILRGTPIAYPPLAEQRRIIVYLDGLQAKVYALKRLQAEAAAELDALLPSILDRAFKGEL
jgi:type I restriction enzyme S subunit